MDEQLFYIQNCLPGTWENKEYSFRFELGSPNIAIVNNKHNHPANSTGVTYHVVKEDYYYLIRLIYTTESKTWAKDYKIDGIDCAAGVLTISDNGAVWELSKITQ